MQNTLRFARLLVVALLVNAFAHAQAKDDEPVDAVQGNWEGEWTLDSGDTGKLVVQVVAVGGGEYLGVFTGYDNSQQENQTYRLNIRGSTEKDQVVFSQTIPVGNIGTFTWKATVKEEAFVGTFTDNDDHVGKLNLKRIITRPMALGTKPPSGAVVLFDGEKEGEKLDRWENAASWEVVDGALRPRAGDAAPKKHLINREKFRSTMMHLEYRTPFLPDAKGQERGQSGLILHGKYEIQIVDSFGLEPSNVGAAALFEDTAPSKNVALPPGEWQVLDVTFKAPKTSDDGTVLEPGELSVLHNDVLVLDRIKVRSPTIGAPFAKALADVPGFVLENAKQAVEFRNIWMVNID